MRKIAAAALAALTAFSAAGLTATGAEAHRYRNRDGAIAVGVAAAVIAGIALSRHHRHHRYYDDAYYDDGYYYAPRRIYRSYGYYPRSRSYAYGSFHGGRHYRGSHVRSYNPAYPHFHGRRIHARQ